MIKEFFACYNLVSNFEDYCLENDSAFLYNEDLNKLFSDSSSDESNSD